MKNLIAIVFLMFSVTLTSNIQAQCLFGSIVEASREAEEKRLKVAPELAKTLLPNAKEQSNLGSFLINQLTAQSEQETKKHGQGTYTWASGTQEKGYYMNNEYVPDICEGMGITKGTEAFGNCVVELIKNL